MALHLTLPIRLVLILSGYTENREPDSAPTPSELRRGRPANCEPNTEPVVAPN
jgi:hypothetical protein